MILRRWWPLPYLSCIMYALQLLSYTVGGGITDHGAKMHGIKITHALHCPFHWPGLALDWLSKVFILYNHHNMKIMSPMKILLLLLISLLIAAIVSNCQRFDFPSSPSRSPGLQVDGDGKVYTSVGNQLYRLNSNLQLEESRRLSSEAVNISLSSNVGCPTQKVKVCKMNLSQCFRVDPP